jgi:Na+/H+-dicarboxylate symporter
MNLALQRRRLVIAMTVTVAALVVAMAAIVATFGFHQAWGMWLFAGAILFGFASHGWLVLGVMREKSAP